LRNGIFASVFPCKTPIKGKEEQYPPVPELFFLTSKPALARDWIISSKLISDCLEDEFKDYSFGLS
jgi:hypothetical protein